MTLLAGNVIAGNTLGTALLASGNEVTRRSFLLTTGIGLAGLALGGCGDTESLTTGDSGTSGYGPDTGTETGDEFVAPSDFNISELTSFETRFPSALAANASTITAALAGQIVTLPASQGDVATALNLGNLGSRTLNAATTTTNGRAVIMSDDLNGESGFYDLALDGSGTPNFWVFPEGYSYGGGATYVASYNQGAVLVYEVGGSGVVHPNSVSIIETTGFNVTSSALLDENTLVVLNSGDFSESAEARLDFINIATGLVTDSISLGNRTAQVGGNLAITDDGRAVIGAGDRSGRALIVNLNDGTYSELSVEGGNFHSSIRVAGNLAYITDYNGIVSVYNLIEQSLLRALDIQASEAGSSVLSEAGLIQLVNGGALLISPAA